MMLVDENSLICQGRQIDGLLQLIDAKKNNPNITLKEVLDTFSESYGFDPRENDFAFYNQWQLINSLYAYICIPKEKNFTALPDIPLSDLSKKWGLKKQHQVYTLNEFIRFMRNAISHGHIEVNESLIFTFKDNNKCFSFYHMDLHKFCQALAYWCLTKDVTLKDM